MVNKGYISVVKDSANDFGVGNASGLLESTGSLGGLKESAKGDFATTYLPGPNPSTTTGGAGLAIPAGLSDDRKKIAVKFLDFITSTENTITFAQATGYMPVRSDAKDQDSEKKYLTKTPTPSPQSTSWLKTPSLKTTPASSSTAAERKSAVLSTRSSLVKTSPKSSPPCKIPCRRLSTATLPPSSRNNPLFFEHPQTHGVLL